MRLTTRRIHPLFYVCLVLIGLLFSHLELRLSAPDNFALLFAFALVFTVGVLTQQKRAITLNDSTLIVRNGGERVSFHVKDIISCARHGKLLTINLHGGSAEYDVHSFREAEVDRLIEIVQLRLSANLPLAA